MYDVKFDRRLRKWVVVDERSGKILYKSDDRYHAYKEASKLTDAEDAELELKMLRGMSIDA